MAIDRKGTQEYYSSMTTNTLRIAARISPEDYKLLRIELIKKDTNFSEWIRSKIKEEIDQKILL